MNETEIKENILMLDSGNDVVFKAIMLTHPNILKAILKTLLHKRIGNLKIMNAELPKLQFIEKGKHLDIYLETRKEYVDVEVSTGYSDSIQNRNLSYICHVFCQVVKKGEKYTEYKKTTIFNLIWNSKSSYLCRTGKLTDEYGNIISDMITYNMFYMDKCMETYYNKDIKFIQKYKYLIMLGLRIDELDELIELTKGDGIVKEYKEALEEVLNDDEIAPYISKEQDERMLRNGLREEAFQQGKEQERKSLVQKLLSKNMTILDVANMLDIPVDELGFLLK